MARYLITALSEDGRVYSSARGLVWTEYSDRHLLRPMRQAEAAAEVHRLRDSRDYGWLYRIEMIRLPRRRFSDRPSPRYNRY